MITVTPQREGNRFEVHIEGAAAPIIYDWAAPHGAAVAPHNDDFALLAALSYAMKRGGALHVRGRVDSKLLSGAEKFAEVWASWRPDLFRALRVSADKELDPMLPDNNHGYAFAISGGLDSVFSLLRNSAGADGRVNRRPGAGYLMDWRNAGEPESDWAAQLRDRARAIADAFDIPFYACTTNWREFSTDFFMDHALGIIAAAHCLNATASGCVLAADAAYRDELRLAPLGNNHTTNPMLSSSAFEAINFGASFLRMEKMRQAAVRPDLVAQMVVCHAKVPGKPNCGRCEKCVRTGLELFAVTGSPSPILEALPDPWRVAWMKPMAYSSVVFWREMLAFWPKGHGALRMGIDFLLWRSMLQRGPLLKALKSVERRVRRAS
jgi:hypothetical protein